MKKSFFDDEIKKNDSEDVRVDSEDPKEEPIVKEAVGKKRELEVPTYHTIQRGDSLESIQKQYGIEFKDFKGLNRSSLLTNLVVGQKIRIK